MEATYITICLLCGLIVAGGLLALRHYSNKPKLVGKEWPERLKWVLTEE